MLNILSSKTSESESNDIIYRSLYALSCIKVIWGGDILLSPVDMMFVTVWVFTIEHNTVLCNIVRRYLNIFELLHNDMRGIKVDMK